MQDNGDREDRRELPDSIRTGKYKYQFDSPAELSPAPTPARAASGAAKRNPWGIVIPVFCILAAVAVVLAVLGTRGNEPEETADAARVVTSAGESPAPESSAGPQPSPNEADGAASPAGRSSSGEPASEESASGESASEEPASGEMAQPSSESVQSGGVALKIIDLDGSVTEEMRASIERVFTETYPRMNDEFGRAQSLYSEVIVYGKRDTETPGIVAYASGNTITFSTQQLTENPEDYDMITHELMHVVQSYPVGYPSWIVEGIADYGRYLFGLNNAAAGWYLPSRAVGHYTDGYTTTAAFFKWLEENYPGIIHEANAELQSGVFADSYWESRTGYTVDELWDRYAAG